VAEGLIGHPPVEEPAAAFDGVQTSPDQPSEPRYQQAFLSTVIAGPGDHRLALFVVLLSAAGFVAAAPFAKLPLLRLDAFIPAYAAALVLIDAITAAMLLGQYRGSGAPALLVLAAAYVYDAVMTAAHLLSFPGAFSLSGLLGGGAQTTVWIYVFWHGGFPLFVMLYAAVAWRGPRGRSAPHGGGAMRLGLTVFGGALLALGMVALAANADTLLPPLMAGNVQLKLPSIYTIGSVWLISFAAAIVLCCRRDKSVLDLWLCVVMCAWVSDVALSAVLDAGRFDLGFYVGRAYGLLAASFVLGVLLVETGGLHSRLATAKALVDDYARRLEERVQQRTAELEEETAERRKTEMQLHQSQKMEALGQLTGGLAHDFNNHLSIIIGNLDLLGDQRGLNDAQKELIGEALTAAFSGAELTRRLLAFARRQPLRPVRIDVSKLIEEITRLLSRTLGEQIQIELNLDPTIPAITADPSQLQTAIANLANNARDAMPKGGRLTITTGVRFLDEDYAAEHIEVTPGGYVLIAVSDSGTGMPPDVLDPRLRAVFHDQGSGQGHRARPQHGVRLHEAVGRPHQRLQRARLRHDVPPLPAAGRHRRRGRSWAID
jgi:signal transduction histidine kinase